jgi:nicotinamide-nucleotide adenylyltransferase
MSLAFQWYSQAGGTSSTEVIGLPRNQVALFIGRFQPFHKGHLHAIRWIAEKSARVIVAIGSSQEKGTPENPYTAKKRRAMVKAALCESGLDGKCRVFLLADINNDEKWVAHVDASLPRYGICYSNNPLVLRLMREGGKKAARVPFLRRRYYNATAIRERMRQRLGWKERVPKAVAEEIKGR